MADLARAERIGDIADSERRRRIRRNKPGSRRIGGRRSGRPGSAPWRVELADLDIAGGGCADAARVQRAVPPSGESWYFEDAALFLVRAGKRQVNFAAVHRSGDPVEAGIVENIAAHSHSPDRHHGAILTRVPSPDFDPGRARDAARNLS